MNDDRTALVTGAGRRLGRDIALALGKWGFKVCVHAHRSVAEAQAVVDEITAAGGRAHAVAVDLARADAGEALIGACTEVLGAPSCLVNNASVFEHDEIATLEADRWDRHIAINLRAPLLLAKAMAAHLPAGGEGAIVNILDQRIFKPTPHFLSYAIGKAGLAEATRMLAQGLAPRIRVNGIAPGPLLQSVHQTRDAFEAQTRATLLGRGPATQDIVAAIRFILDTPSMTGEIITLDGGQHLAWQTADVGDGRG